jgi:altronate dehydratase large subunit
MVAAGAQVVAFTTGRGSITGHAIAPVLKITGNSETDAWMAENMDINAGAVINGSETLQMVGERIFNEIVEVASGKKTKAETLGQKDFVVFARDRISEHLMGFC